MCITKSCGCKTCCKLYFVTRIQRHRLTQTWLCVLVQKAIKVNLSWLVVIKVSSCVIDYQQQQTSSLLLSTIPHLFSFLSLYPVCFLLLSTSIRQYSLNTISLSHSMHTQGGTHKQKKTQADLMRLSWFNSWLVSFLIVHTLTVCPLTTNVKV